MTAPHYVNENKSDIRGIKPGWYAMDHAGKLTSGPFFSHEECLSRGNQPILVIDAKIKSNYATRDEAFNAGLEIKRKFPVVNVTVWDVSEGTRTAVKLPQ